MKALPHHLCVLLMLIVLSMPSGSLSSLMVYLGSTLASNLLLFMFHNIPIGFSPLASHCSTVFSEINAC